MTTTPPTPATTGARAPEAVCVVRGLTVGLTSGVDVVDDVDLTLTPGQIVGLVGAFGSMLAGLEFPAAAEADLTDLRARLDEVLASPPILILRARALAAAHQSYVDTLTRALRGARKATR